MSQETLLSTTLAGVTAGVVESFVLYPLEYLKVREQIAIRPHNIQEKFSIPNFNTVFWRGSSAFALGNATKAVVRFNFYNWATKFMAGNDKVVTAPQLVVAGILTGIAETLIVVPFENIKTTMIEASAWGKGAAVGALPVPGIAGTTATRVAPVRREATNQTGQNGPRKIRPVAPKVTEATSNGLYTVRAPENFRSTVAHMFQERGLRSFVQGFNPTVIRQITNSGIRFTTYNFFKQLLVPSDRSVSLGGAVGLAGLSALAEVVVTQPIDVVKSRMQTTNGIKIYGNALLCSYRIFTEEGPQRLWSGFVPRWLRVWASGGVIFVVYEQSNKIFASGLKENPFSWK